ncbi:hypothetical protein FHS38_007073 [Streptomyces netropsis]|uniref:Secreted protein n=1 Tax=Streptomyces netropsis TaxID=55404 RepID=A0A7W7LIT7_STRNE|nr:hypothetical protein [Streptomyces netropsis]GGR50798.1 hypothetical protein GCM10010219_64980 [Streptomyces netropsis]
MTKRVAGMPCGRKAVGKARKVTLALAAVGGMALSIPASTASAASGDRVIWTNQTHDVQFATGDCVADASFRYVTALPHPNTMYATIRKVSGPAWCRFSVELAFRDRYNQHVTTGEVISASSATVTGLGTRCSVKVSIQRSPTNGWYSYYLNNNNGTC